MSAMATERANDRHKRLARKTAREAREEYAAAAAYLRQRPDYHQVWDYFLEIIGQPLSPALVRERTGRPVVEHLCNQAPLEIFHALGLQPLRLASGCCAVSRLADAALPALMCPLLRSALGMETLDTCEDEENPAVSGHISEIRIIPTTCDWTVKFAELAAGLPSPPAHFLEVPHLRHSERGQMRFQEELFLLIEALEAKSGRRLRRAALVASVDLYMGAWALFEDFLALRRDGRLPAVWFTVICGAFLADTVENWVAAARPLLAYLQTQEMRPPTKAVFLCGSPILFPNLKLLRLIEEAGMYVAADDLCASERLWPGGLRIDDRSFSGLVRALAGRYHRACQCPTFADNERRFNSIRISSPSPDGLPYGPPNGRPGGIVHHVLKGCHPFDIASLGLERQARQAGIPFIRIETEYSPEDGRTILTRLEAFANIVQGG